MLDAFLRGDYGLAPTNYPALVLGTLLAFLCGQLIAWVYMLTHSGVSYSRAFVVSLVLMPVIVALVMNVLSNNLITAFGMMAVFAIVRFRNILRDTLDTAYLLGVIVLGMACGMQKFTTAVISCLAIACILTYVWYSSFGARHRYDLILHLRWLRPSAEVGALRNLLNRHCSHVVFANVRAVPGATGADHSYRLLLRDPERIEEFLRELSALDGVTGISSATAGDESEI